MITEAKSTLRTEESLRLVIGTNRASELRERVRRYAELSASANTRRAYRSDWMDFTAWCAEQHRSALPASSETLAQYIADRARELKTSTIRRRLAAISQAHELAGLQNPTDAGDVREVWKGIRRSKGMAPDQKTPILLDDLKAMLAASPENLTGHRDRALLLIGFSGALRRSELVGVDVEHVDKTRDGLIVRLPYSKTNQEGEEEYVAIPWGEHEDTCPRRAYEAWLSVSNIEMGPVFRGVTRWQTIREGRLSTQGVADIIKKYAEAVGLDPNDFAGHSLRSGFATEAANAGAEERLIMNHGRWKDIETARRYIRKGSAFRENAAQHLGL